MLKGIKSLQIPRVLYQKPPEPLQSVLTLFPREATPDVLAPITTHLFSARYHPRIQAKIKGATMVASDSMMYLGVSNESFPQVIFSFGTAPE
jgi:hypothetical protein